MLFLCSAADICKDLNEVTCKNNFGRDFTGISSKAGASPLEELKKNLAAAIQKYRRGPPGSIEEILNPPADEVFIQKYFEGLLGNVQVPIPPQFANNDKFIEKFNFVHKELMATSQITERRAAARDTFEKLKNHYFEDVISKLGFPEETKKQIVDRVKAIELSNAPCTIGANTIQKRYEINAQLELVNGKMQVKICDGLLFHSGSEFSLALILGHELAHAIDPCRLQQAGIIRQQTTTAAPGRPSSTSGVPQLKSAPAPASSLLQVQERQSHWHHLINCLRTSSSIGAQNHREAGNTANAARGICGSDQINEAFSDWMGTEVMTHMIKSQYPTIAEPSPGNIAIWKKGIANVFRPLCDDRSPLGSLHPQTKERMNKIILANQSIRQQLGCAPDPTFKYCSNSNVKNLSGSQTYTAPASAEPEIK